MTVPCASERAGELTGSSWIKLHFFVINHELISVEYYQKWM
jgi:hypothetical protein